MSLQPFTDTRGNILLDFIAASETALAEFVPLTHALVVARHEGRVLLIFNVWRKCWELPGGVIDAGESARDAALRELAEESGQVLSGTPRLCGVTKFDLAPGWQQPSRRIEHGALFLGDIATLQPFRPNAESEAIKLWQPGTPLAGLSEMDAHLVTLALQGRAV